MLVVLPSSISSRHAAGHQHGLHVALGLREVEQLAAVGVAAHLDEPLRLVVADVRERCGPARRRTDRARRPASSTTPSASSRSRFIVFASRVLSFVAMSCWYSCQLSVVSYRLFDRVAGSSPKGLHRIAQGCRCSGYPGERLPRSRINPEGVV